MHQKCQSIRSRRLCLVVFQEKLSLSSYRFIRFLFFTPKCVKKQFNFTSFSFSISYPQIATKRNNVIIVSKEYNLALHAKKNKEIQRNINLFSVF